MTVQVLHGDCLELMKSLPDKSIDLFICDLPYGLLQPNRIFSDEAKSKYGRKRMMAGADIAHWDVKIDLTKFWEQVERLCKNEHTPVLHFCNTKFGIDLINSKPNWFRYDIVWNKGAGVSFQLANVMPMKSHEMIYVFSKKGSYYKRINVDNRCPLSVINFPSTKKNVHPTEKCVDMYKWLISRYCPEGGTVCDPTAGSFNSIQAAKDLGFNAIGMEKDDKFYKRAAEKFGINIPENIIEHVV